MKAGDFVSVGVKIQNGASDGYGVKKVMQTTKISQAETIRGEVLRFGKLKSNTPRPAGIANGKSIFRPVDSKTNIFNCVGNSIQLVIAALMMVVTGCSHLSQTGRSLTSYVNPFVGTTVLTNSADLGYVASWRTWNGLNAPAATVPFAMVQAVPITTYGSGSGYEYEVNTIKAFAQTSDTQWGKQNIPIMPLEGSGFTADDFASKFNHAGESAHPGYYQVRLERYDINAEVTATRRCAYYKFTYLGGQEKKLAFDLVHSGGGSSDWDLQQSGDYAVSGKQGGLCFYCVMNERIKSIDTYKRDPNQPVIPRSGQGAGGRRRISGKIDVPVISFEKESKPLEVKIALSYTSIEAAKHNLEVEIGGKSFIQVRKEANQNWETMLDKIQVTGGTDRQKELFYSCLFRQFWFPSLTSDAGAEFEALTSPALWDTFRTKLVLLDMLLPDVSNEIINSMLRRSARSGFLPTSFHGDFGSAYITGSYLRGVTNFDVQEAFHYMLNNANTGDGNRARPHNKEYMALGYVPEANLAHPVTETKSTAGTTKTLEYAYSDYSIARLAQALGDTNTYNEMLKRSQNYKNVFDPETELMRGRLADGTWYAPFDPYYPYYEFMYREANAWQASFFVPQDTQGLISLYKSPADFERKLDDLFTIPWKGYARDNLSCFLGQFCMGNQPDFNYPYLYYFVNKPEKSQAVLTKLLFHYFGMGAEGLALPGMDDQGSLTGWYVFNAMGIYPYSPADPEYIVSVPIFDKIAITLGNGETFTIVKKGKGDNIDKITIGDKPLDGWFVKHTDMLQGKEMKIYLK
ncbi:MAG TPA: GH92 family glycosyl hydrolase [Verrucomicrobiae bacterium]|nr:GH92 family glycosyl hydrolase [Verrucomicrobiae bacterium]